MLVYRIQKAKYASDISGFGSTLVSGRWHQAGKHPILYTSSNISLAILECLVHLPTVVKPPDLVLLTLEVPDSSIVKPETKDLPENWDKKRIL
jgi:RES domain-containing protein